MAGGWFTHVPSSAPAWVATYCILCQALCVMCAMCLLSWGRFYSCSLLLCYDGAVPCTCGSNEPGSGPGNGPGSEALAPADCGAAPSLTRNCGNAVVKLIDFGQAHAGPTSGSPDDIGHDAGCILGLDSLIQMLTNLLDATNQRPDS